MQKMMSATHAGLLLGKTIGFFRGYLYRGSNARFNYSVYLRQEFKKYYMISGNKSSLWPSALFYPGTELLTKATFFPSGDQEGKFIVPWPP
jgi:hypothetical protein